MTELEGGDPTSALHLDWFEAFRRKLLRDLLPTRLFEQPLKFDKVRGYAFPPLDVAFVARSRRNDIHDDDGGWSNLIEVQLKDRSALSATPQRPPDKTIHLYVRDPPRAPTARLPRNLRRERPGEACPDAADARGLAAPLLLGDDDDDDRRRALCFLVPPCVPTSFGACSARLGSTTTTDTTKTKTTRTSIQTDASMPPNPEPFPKRQVERGQLPPDWGQLAPPLGPPHPAFLPTHTRSVGHTVNLSHTYTK